MGYGMGFDGTMRGKGGFGAGNKHFQCRLNVGLVATYHDLAWMLLAHGDDVAIDLQGEGLGEGHGFAAPVVVLHLDSEWDKLGVPLGAEGCELVDAGPLEVVSQPIEGGVVRVTRPDAREVLHGLAPWDATDHRTLLMGFTPPLPAGHLATIASTPALACPIVPKLLLGLVGAPVVDTSAGLHGDAGVVVEDEALVAMAPWGTGFTAGGGTSGVGAGGGTPCPTGLEVTVLGASLSCWGES